MSSALQKATLQPVLSGSLAARYACPEPVLLECWKDWIQFALPHLEAALILACLCWEGTASTAASGAGSHIPMDSMRMLYHRKLSRLLDMSRPHIDGMLLHNHR